MDTIRMGRNTPGKHILSLVFGLTSLVFVCGLLISGCSESNRYSLQGTVTLDGQPLENGTISFRPQAGTSGPTTGGPIAAGRFEILADKGLFAGTFRVEITAERDTGSTITDPDTGKTFPRYEQFVPARYNEQSELEAEVTSGGDNEFDFALTSPRE